MREYIMSEEEKAYLEGYDISDYDRPSVAADMAVFSIMGIGDEDVKDTVRSRDNYRKDPQKKLKLLLIRRASYPYKNSWALPGGFCKKGESTIETARRELYEETSVKDAYLRPFDIFSETDRDPRGWIISHAFLTLINGEKYKVHAGTDAWEAAWFSISVEKKEQHKEVEEDSASIESSYVLQLTCEQKDDLKLQAAIKESRQFKNYHETVSYDILDSEGLAFDHAKIILCAFLALQKEVSGTGKIIFELMPEKFTLSELQNAFEIVQGKKLIVPNFRRKMADYVIETEEAVEGVGHRPAKLFKRNLDTFYG